MGLVAVQVVVAGTLMLAACGKLAAPHVLHSTLRQLGIKPYEQISIALPAAEFGIAAAVIVSPSRPATVMLVSILGISVASVGLWVRVQGRTVSCACFGALSGGGSLGLRQALAMPLWITSALGLAALDESGGLSTVLLYTAALVAVLSVLIAARGFRAAIDAHAYIKLAR